MTLTEWITQALEERFRPTVLNVIDESQQHVSGEVRLSLHGGRAVVTGRRSEASLYDFGMATYDTGDTFDQTLAKGFVQLWGLPSRLAAARDARLG